MSPALGSVHSQGTVPSSWRHERLGDMAQFVNGFGFDQDTWTRGKGKPIIRIQNLTGTSARINYFDGELPAKYCIKRGDILVSWSATLGVFTWQGDEAWLNQHIFKVTELQPWIRKDFLYFLLTFYIRSIAENARGSTMQHLTRKQFLSTLLPIPPLDEQRRIACVLSTIRQAIETQDRVLAAARHLKRSLMHYLFAYGPVPLTEAAGMQFKNSDIGAIPWHWRVSRAAELCTDIVDCPHSTPDWKDSGLLAIKNVNIRDGQLRLPPYFYVSEQEYACRVKRLVPQPGDVLLSREAPVGEACLIPRDKKVCLGQRIMLMRSDERVVVNKFLIYVFYSPTIHSVLEKLGVGPKHINVAAVRELHLPVPPHNEQIAIARCMQAADDKITAEKGRRSALGAIFDCILHDLMIGRRRIASQGQQGIHKTSSRQSVTRNRKLTVALDGT